MQDEYERIIIMKYGTHASEAVDSIISRKCEEIKSEGVMFWGYGGVLCHPIKQVKPFMAENVRSKKKTYLLLSRTESNLYNAPQRQEQYSFDKTNWEKIPNGICVLGSKYALICKSLRKCEMDINLSDYHVAVGNSTNRNLSEYMKGRVDKACAVKGNNNGAKPNFIKIAYVAEIDDRGAVFVK